MKFNLLYEKSLDKLGDLLYEKKKVKGTTVVSDPDTGISVSDEENYVYDKLKEKYGAKDIDKQFKDKEKFPWNADFYIKSENMIIEYRSHWTHGRKKWNPDNPKHQEELEWLKSKHNEFYDRTIDTWTRLDPEKEKTALKNGFKYVVFYNIDEFEKWLENPSLTYEEYKEPIALKYSDVHTDKYYHDKEQKDRWNDGRDKNSPNEDKVEKHKKDKKESLDNIVLHSIVRLVNDPSSVGRVSSYHKDNFCIVLFPRSNINTTYGKVFESEDFSWKGQTIPRDQLEIASEDQLNKNIEVYKEATREVREKGQVTQEEASQILKDIKSKTKEIANTFGSL